MNELTVQFSLFLSLCTGLTL